MAEREAIAERSAHVIDDHLYALTSGPRRDTYRDGADAEEFAEAAQREHLAAVKSSPSS
jgi:hypothetical protein